MKQRPHSGGRSRPRTTRSGNADRSWNEWLFEFLQFSFAAATSGQLLGLRQDADDFAHRASSSVIEMTRDYGFNDGPVLPTVNLLKDLQQGLLDGMKALRNDDLWRIGRTAECFLSVEDGRVVQAFRRGVFREVFFFAAVDAIKESWTQVRWCPQCDAPFWKIRRQEYCSPSCSQKARWKRFVDSKKRRERNFRNERERAVRKRAGPGSKVKLGTRNRRVR